MFIVVVLFGISMLKCLVDGLKVLFLLKFRNSVSVVFFFVMFIIGIFSVVVWVKMNSGRLFRLSLFLLFGLVFGVVVLLLFFIVVFVLVLGWLLVLLFIVVFIFSSVILFKLINIWWCGLLFFCKVV